MARTPSITSALTRALKTAPVRPEDAALVALARAYALQLDAQPDQVSKITPGFVAVLAELGMTPRSRAGASSARGGATGVSPARTKLDQLRERRRPNRAAPVDPTAS